MIKKRFIIKKGVTTPCPKCKNDTDFFVLSDYCAEDCCEVWIQCKCGYDPTACNTYYRMEDVMGAINKPNIITALQSWDLAIKNRPIIEIED
jgi:hypothetical protein